MTDLPAPQWATFPDGGHYVDKFDVADPTLHITAHDSGELRVWKGEVNAMMGERPYYPIQAVGMAEHEVVRALNVAVKLLAIPHNRRRRRAMHA